LVDAIEIDSSENERNDGCPSIDETKEEKKKRTNDLDFPTWWFKDSTNDNRFSLYLDDYLCT
jgi:hypothetical protein